VTSTCERPLASGDWPFVFLCRDRTNIRNWKDIVSAGTFETLVAWRAKIDLACGIAPWRAVSH